MLQSKLKDYIKECEKGKSNYVGGKVWDCNNDTRKFLGQFFSMIVNQSTNIDHQLLNEKIPSLSDYSQCIQPDVYFESFNLFSRLDIRCIVSKSSTRSCNFIPNTNIVTHTKFRSSHKANNKYR